MTTNVSSLFSTYNFFLQHCAANVGSFLNKLVGNHVDELVGHHEDKLVGNHEDKLVGNHEDKLVSNHAHKQFGDIHVYEIYNRMCFNSGYM